jgi:hypothetical protein
MGDVPLIDSLCALRTMLYYTPVWTADHEHVYNTVRICVFDESMSLFMIKLTHRSS